MSEPEGGLPIWPPPREPPHRGGGCLTALMLVVGIVLLLPGLLCAFVAAGNPSLSPGPFGPILGLLVVGGIALVVFAVSRMRR